MTWTIKRTNQFKKNYKKLPEYIQDAFKKKFALFMEDFFDPSLSTHKLKGKFVGCVSSSISDDYRFITIIEPKVKMVTLVNIGNHGIYK